MVAFGAGVSSEDAQLSEASRRAVMDWSWESDWSVGAYVRSSVILVSPWRMRSSRVTTGLVMV